MAFRNSGLWIIAAAFAEDVILVLQLTIYIYIMFLDFNGIPRYSDDPLNEVPAFVLWILENMMLMFYLKVIIMMM